jgi:hypothetical protein
MMAKPVAVMKGDAASNQRPFYAQFHARTIERSAPPHVPHPAL